MRWLGTVCTITFLTGCTSTGEIAPNLGQRLYADARCLSALSAAGLSVYATGTPQAGVAAVDVLRKINDVGTSDVPVTTLAACADTINHAVADAQGIRVKVKGATVPDPKLIKN